MMYEVSKEGLVGKGFLREIHWGTRYEIARLETLNNVIEEHLGKISTYYYEMAKKSEDEDERQLAEYLDDSSTEYGGVFLQYTRGSQLVAVMSFIEVELRRVYEALFKGHFLMRLSDVRGNGVDRSRRYFQRVVEIELPEFFKSNGDYELLRILRNAVVHSQYYVPKDKKKKVKELLESNSQYDGFFLVQVDESSGFILLGEEFLAVLLERVKGMFEEFFPICSERLTQFEQK